MEGGPAGRAEIPMRYVNPEALAVARGYNNGVLMAPNARGILFIAGQIGWNGEGQLVSDRLVDQFDQALANVIAVVGAAGGGPEAIGKLTIFVTSVDDYRSARKEIGERYRERMGKHFPAMSLVEVKALLEPGAMVEIEGLACL
jgi:enamine deaminase RidA (YjgF/YER057c/UK114 family)